MNALVLANFPIAALIFAAIVGIPLWLTFKRPDRGPQMPAAPEAAVSQAAASQVATASQAAVASRYAAPRTGARVSPARQHAAV